MKRKIQGFKVKAEGEVAYLPSHPVSPPIRELRKQIEIEIGTYLRSNRELDGFIRDKYELYNIACLLKIRELLNRKS